MFAVADRIFETSVTAGLGTYTLDGAQPGFQAFSVIGANNECTYFATDDTFWEVGIGKYLSTPNRLTREAILASSNAGAAVNWGGQTVKLRCSVPAAGITAKRMLTKSVAGAANVTLTQDEQRRQVLKFTGALTGNINIVVDETIWSWIVHNATTGDFTLTVKTAAGAGVVVQQSSKERLYCDGVDVLLVRKAVGADGAALIADATQGDGLIWVPQYPPSLTPNPFFQVDQLANAATARADDAYGHDHWYVLTQTASIQVSTQTDQEDGQPSNARLTQNQAAAQRMGYACIIEGKDCKHLRGQQVTFRPRVRISNSQAVRIAILQWTGAENAVTSDVVNDWTSADYTDGAAQFFVDANFTPAGNGAKTPAANTWTDMDALTVTLGSAFNNLVLFVWTEGTAAQNVTLDIGKVRFVPGPHATNIHMPTFAEVLHYAQRYFSKTFDYGTAPAQNAGTAGAIYQIAAGTSAGIRDASWRYPREMRATPTLTSYNPSAANANWSSGETVSAQDTNASGCTITNTAVAVDGSGAYIHLSADARL